jgi:hypothetical protein
MPTPSKAMKYADKLTADLVTAGYLILLAPGKYRPALIKKCGTCKHLTYPTGFDKESICGKDGTTRVLSDSCSKHSFKQQYVELHKAGLPLEG